MPSQAKPCHLPKLCINKEIWYPPSTDASSKTPTTANPLHPRPRNKALLANHKRKSRFFPQTHDDGSKTPLTKPLPFNPPATPPPTLQSPFIYYPTRCPPILPSPSLLLPLSFLPSPVLPPLPLSPIAPPSAYYRRQHQSPKEEEETYEKLGSAALLQDSTFHLEDNLSFLKDTALYLEDNVVCLKDRAPYFGTGHAPSGSRNIDTPAVKRFFRGQWERRVWEVLMRV